MKKVFGKQPYTSVLVTSNISKYYDYNRAFSYFASMKPTAAPRDSLSLSKCLTRTGRHKRQSRTLNSQRNQKKNHNIHKQAILNESVKAAATTAIINADPHTVPPQKLTTRTVRCIHLLFTSLVYHLKRSETWWISTVA